MGSLWLKIKIWTKTVVFGLLALYVLLFIYNNSGQGKTVRLWVFFGHEPERSVLAFTFFAFVVGVIGTLLVRTTWKTMRQVQDLRQRARTERLEREMADMKAKAARLNVKPAVPESGSEEETR